MDRTRIVPRSGCVAAAASCLRSVAVVLDINGVPVCGICLSVDWESGYRRGVTREFVYVSLKVLAPVSPHSDPKILV